MNTPALLSIEDVSFAYGNQEVLSHIHWELAKGEFALLIGPNGGGKTTLIELILGLKTPSQGKITLLGQPPNQAAKYLGYVPQNTHRQLDTPISLLDLVILGLPPRLGFRYGTDEINQAMQALEQTGVAHLSHRPLKALSGGQRQRGFIARALVAQPQMLILDEPTANIDPQGRHELETLLVALKAQVGILMISHDWNQLLPHVDQVAYLNQTLALHSAQALSGAQSMSQNIARADGHWCEVELLEALVNTPLKPINPLQSHQACP